MGSLCNLVAAVVAFVGIHFLLSHPLRGPLVQRVGEQAFLGIYSALALATFAWVIWAMDRAPAEPLWWVASPPLWGVATLLMLVASLLLVGSLIGNPALPPPMAPRYAPDRASGVFAVTRHPMMWSFIFWAIVHAMLWGSAANLILTAGIAILAFFGALAQDAKKGALRGERWRDWQARTAFWPFAAQLAGRASWRDAIPGPLVWIGGFVLWLVATGAHGWLGGPIVGPWIWFA